MNTPQEHHEQPPAPGERVRRFLDSEPPVGVQTGHPGSPDPDHPGEAAQREPVTPSSAPAHVEHPAASATTAADDTARAGGAQRVGLINDVVALRDEWQRVQGTFVDDPQRAVHEASVLIDRTLDEIRMNVGSGHPSETTSTEDLRVRFQRYREFFQRLLSA